MICTCNICGREKHYPKNFEKWPNVHLKSKPEMYPVCKYGSPDYKTTRFICDRCLSYANTMKGYISSIAKGLIITEHAAQRFVERIRLNLGNTSKVRKSILKVFQMATKVKSEDKSALMIELSSNYVDADYYCFQNMVFVVSEDYPNKKILTVFRREKKRKISKVISSS